MELQRLYERGLEQRIAAVLAPAVGADRVAVRVAATLDFTSRETTSERYSPASDAARTRRVQRESYDRAPEEPDSRGDYDRRDEAVEYELNREVTLATTPPGVLKDEHPENGAARP